MPTVAVRDIEMYYESYGEGEPLLLIAGLGGTSNAWTAHLPALSAERRCLVFDNRGVGQTTTTVGPYTIAQLAEDAAGLLEALGVPAADVLGASLGGAIAQELAIRHPERVRRLILTSCWARTPAFNAQLVQSWKVIRRRAGVYAYNRQLQLWSFTRRYFEERGEAIDDVKDLVGERPEVQSQQGFEAQVDAVVGHDTLARLQHIVAPTLVVAGELDILTPPALSRELAARIHGARLVLIPEGGHAVFWEQREAYLDVVVDFLHRGSNIEDIGPDSSRCSRREQAG